MAAQILLHNARLIDGLRDEPLEKASILIDGERIAAVRSRRDSRRPAGAEVIDLAGKTVTPGLIDTHVHTVMIGDEGLKLFMANGITVGARLRRAVGTGQSRPGTRWHRAISSARGFISAVRCWTAPNRACPARAAR